MPAGIWLEYARKAVGVKRWSAERDVEPSILESMICGEEKELEKDVKRDRLSGATKPLV